MQANRVPARKGEAVNYLLPSTHRRSHPTGADVEAVATGDSDADAGVHSRPEDEIPESSAEKRCASLLVVCAEVPCAKLPVLCCLTAEEAEVEQQPITIASAACARLTTKKVKYM